MTEYSPISAEAKRRTAHGAFTQLRQSCPVHYQRIPEEQVVSAKDAYLVAAPTEEFYSVFRYEDCMRVLQEPGIFSSKEGPGPERAVLPNEDGMLLTADDPAHRRQRQIANQAFFPKMIELRRQLIQDTIDDLIDDLGPRGSLDVINDVGAILTTTLIADIIGVAQDRKSDIQRWAIDIIGAFGGDNDAMERAVTATMEMNEFLIEIIDERREALARGEQLPKDMLSVLLTADYEGSRFSDEEILMACQQMLGAGYETTTTALGNGVYLLCTHPQEREKLENNWSLLDDAVEEVLRIEAPVEGTFRTTTRDVEVAGTSIPAGAKVRVVYASANRDENVFSEPHEFRIDRNKTELRKHLSFAHGIHACLGAALARAELRAGFETLFRRLPGLTLDPDHEPVPNISMTINGFTSLMIRWDPAMVQPRTAMQKTAAVT